MNSKKSPKPLRAAGLAGLVGASTLLLAACGGGSDDGGAGTMPTATSSVPDSALASSSAYAQFALSLSQDRSETAEPLDASKVATPPSSETDEPLPVG